MNINQVNFEKCSLLKRDDAMKDYRKKVEDKIYKFDFTEMLNIVAVAIDNMTIATEEHPSVSVPLHLFYDYLDSINIKKSEWMGIINRLVEVLINEFGYDANVHIKKVQFTNDIQEIIVRL